MSQKPLAQSAAQAGASGEATGVGPAVGGVRRSDELNWLDLWAMKRHGPIWHRREGTLLVRMRRRGGKERELARKG